MTALGWKDVDIKKIFIADDSLTVSARLISLLLEIDDVNVVGYATNGIQAIHSIRQLRPDIAILDIRMPDMNGLQVLRQIKQHAPAPVTIMLTNHALDQFKRQSLEAGADYFLDKSTEVQELLAILRSLSKNDADTDEQVMKSDTANQNMSKNIS